MPNNHAPMIPSKRRATEASSHGDTTLNTSITPAPAKRQRVTRACDQCRIAREKCDGTQPRCFPCVSQDRSCTYEANPRKRGVQPGYIRSLEITLAWIAEKVPTSGEAFNLFLTQDDGRGQRLLNGQESASADRLLRRWRESKMLRDIDRVLSGVEPPSPVLERLSPVGDLGNRNEEAERPAPKLLDLDQSRPKNSQDASPNFSRGSHLYRSTGRPPNLLDDHPPVIVPEGHTPLLSSPTQHAPGHQRLRLPSNHWRLLDTYFSYTHSWFPILEKQALFRTSYLYPKQGLLLDPSDPSCAAHAELWSALALASLQNAASLKSSTPIDREQGQNAVSPGRIYDIARSLIPSDAGPFQIQHTRALLLLALVNIGQDGLNSTWILVGLAIRILLGQDAPQQPGNQQHQPRRQLALAACFILDTLIAIRCNRLPQLKPEDLAETSPVLENDVEEWEPWRPCEGFGVGDGSSHSFRSPAYCLSSFNQLCQIFRVISSERLNAGRGPNVASITHLRQAMEPGLRFNSFVTSPELDHASVPSPYVIRVVFLWAHALLGGSVDTVRGPLIDTIEQYLANFGACGAPPFFAVCLLPFLNDQGNSAASTERPSRLRTLLLSTWNHAAQPSRFSDEEQSDAMAHCTVIAQNRPQSHGVSAAITPSLASSAPIESSFYPSPATSTQPPLTNGLYAGLDSPHMPTNHVRSGMSLASSSSKMPWEMNGNTSAAINGPTVDHFFAQQQQNTGQQAFTNAPVDYDAMLDDLELVGSAENPETDAQFMTNLGFGPGHGVTDILSRDFGSIW
ncbi:MAG: hypothetical protein M1821_001304 [Bathelium mastoideum]|nr:MAG: hypothetical protein M1821_001304 [Bathelium mastoideum]